MILTFVDSPHEIPWRLSVPGLFYLALCTPVLFMLMEMMNFLGFLRLSLFSMCVHISYSIIYLTNKILDCFLSAVSLNMLQ